MFKNKTRFSTLLLVSSILLFTGCEKESEPSAETTDTEESTSGENQFEAGTYTVEVEGHSGPIEVDVTFDSSSISDISITSQNETEGLGDSALEIIKSDILSSQSLSVDVVSGATVASEALLNAVAEAVILAGGNPDLMKSEDSKPNSDVVEELTADVVVVGAGTSGTSAAIAAADKGATVILIEKTDTIGGASNFSWAGKMYNSSAALEGGVEVDLEEEINEWIEFNHWRVDSSVIRRFVTESGETYDWLADKGYQTMFIDFSGEQLHILPEMENRENILRDMLAESVESNGGTILTDTTAKELITSEDGTISGVIAEKRDGTTVNVTAKTVIMATGGYAGNKEMVEEAFGFSGVNGGLAQNVGEGLEMSWDAGAKTPVNFGGQMLHQTLAPATQDLKKTFDSFEASYPLMVSYLPQFMNVGPSGARFRNEETTMEAVAAANTSAFQGPYHYVIVSQNQLTELEKTGMQALNVAGLPGMPPEFYMDFADKFQLDTPWENAVAVFDQMVEDGNGYKGNTVEELAEAAGMDSEYFAGSFANYQTAIETGVDTDFGKNADYLFPMDQGPYYAVKAEINNLGSVGGLVVNNKFQVLNDQNLPLKGLYAVGLEAEGVLFSDTYVGNGIGVGFAFTSGRLGGEEAATEALAE